MTQGTGICRHGSAWWLASTMLTVTALMCLFASPAGARIVVDRFTHHKLSILPPPSRLAAPAASRSATPRTAFAGTPTCSTTVDPNCATPLSYHGGAVQHAENDYLFFWDPSGFASEPDYVSGLQAWLNDLAAADYTTGASAPSVGNPVSVTQEYYDLSGPAKTKRFVSDHVSNAGTIMDTDPFPASGCTEAGFSTCLTQTQLFNELSTYLATNHLPTGVNTEYFILTPPGVGGCSDSHNTNCFVNQFCAWHSVGGGGSGLIIYAFQPYLANTGCDVNQKLGEPNIYTSGIDPVVGTFSHELSETMTDPTLNGWYSNSFDEIGDKCAYQDDVGQSFYTFSGLPQTGGGAYYNAILGSDDYLLQMEYDNRNHGCNQWDTDTQPSATVTAPGVGVLTGRPATFSVGNFAGAPGTSVAYVTWRFGDGATATSVGSAPIVHYYQAAGTYPVNAVVTDTHGNEVQEAPASEVVVVSPSRQQLQSTVNAVIKPGGPAARIGNLLANGGYTFSFSALATGRFHMVWTHGVTTVATVTGVLWSLGPNKLKLALTPAGRSLLSSQSAVLVKSSANFLTATPPAFTDSATFKLVH